MNEATKAVEERGSACGKSEPQRSTDLSEQSWLPIQDNPPPKDGTNVIVSCPRGEGFAPVIGEAYFRADEGEEGTWWWANTTPGDYHADSLEGRGDHPTHWMPMPKPPGGR